MGARPCRSRRERARRPACPAGRDALRRLAGSGGQGVSSRQVVLDTETTGLEVAKGHRITEIGCIELCDRRVTGRRFHRYVNPGRELDAGAIEVTGLTAEFLADKPPFAAVAEEFLAFVSGAELIIHNAAFDVGFLDQELALCGAPVRRLADCATITDTLAMARERFPGKRNSLDALCSRLDIDNRHRTLHGALLDAELLAEVWLAMTSGQADLGLATEPPERTLQQRSPSLPQAAGRRRPLVLLASAEERAAHEAMLARQARISGGVLWTATAVAPSD
ncbi:MAG: DNA polymerase III subunit epsilon [Xanthomonadales bacterium]|nr:DNA polymerase III subunit epsilon [Xanthomonadales bacterium]